MILIMKFHEATRGIVTWGVFRTHNSEKFQSTANINPSISMAVIIAAIKRPGAFWFLKHVSDSKVLSG